MRNIFVFLVLVVLSIGAQANSVGGVPSPKEIVGYWKMVPIDKPELNKVNPWPMPYQWFGFYSDGSLVSMGKTENGVYTRDELSSIFAEVKPSAAKYYWQGEMLIIQNSGSTNQSEVWGVNIFRKDVRFAKMGDLIMTLAGGKDGSPVYYRHLTPVK